MAGTVGHARCIAIVFFAAALAGTASGCGDNLPGYSLSREQLMDPQTCAGCHPEHYRQWSGSMHAHAGDDPLFLAMNKRGQEETGGALGGFCIQCHAPVAVQEGLTVDGLNLDEVPQALKGVTCFFCHTAREVTDDHNNPIVLADDLVLRGRYDDAIENGVHRTGYSALHDSRQLESSTLCGSCHDIITPAGVHLERTFAEYRESIFSRPLGAINTSCSTCHMFSTEGAIADFYDAPQRRRRAHDFPGVDVALIDWPEKDRQQAAIERDLRNVLLAKLCVIPAAGGVQIDYNLDNINAGHGWPSGAAADRRAWAEVRAYVGETVVYESGTIADGQAVTEVATTDPDLWQMRDFIFKNDGQTAHMFWEVAEIESRILPPAVTADITDPAFNHSVTRSYEVLGSLPDRVTATVHIRPVGLDLIDDLVASGHLDAALRDRVPTFTLDGAALEWTSGDGYGCIPK